MAPTTSKFANKKRYRRAPRISLSVKESDTIWPGGKDPVFLTLGEILKIHENQVRLYGGTDGVRDMALLHSALAQPEASFSGHWLHEDLFEMAAAYAFHLCKNHPFLDGNKRTGFVSAVIFLETNGIEFRNPKDIFVEIMLSVAEGKMSKKELATVFRDFPKE